MKVMMMKINHFHSKNTLKKLSHTEKIQTISKCDTHKIQLTIEINFISAKDIYETRVMHSNNHNIENIIDKETGHTLKELFYSFFLNIK